MDDGDQTAPTGDQAVGVYGAARELLESAEREARRIVAEAAQRARAREQEADLLVAKARRVLAAAETKAAVLLADARARAAGTVIDLTDPVPGTTSSSPSGSASTLPASVHAESLPSSLDRLVASAVAHAVHRALPADAAS